MCHSSVSDLQVVVSILPSLCILFQSERHKYAARDPPLLLLINRRFFGILVFFRSSSTVTLSRTLPVGNYSGQCNSLWLQLSFTLDDVVSRWGPWDPGRGRRARVPSYHAASTQLLVRLWVGSWSESMVGSILAARWVVKCDTFLVHFLIVNLVVNFVFPNFVFFGLCTCFFFLHSLPMGGQTKMSYEPFETSKLRFFFPPMDKPS